MMKKLTALLLALMMAAAMTTSALAWGCPNCGNEMDGKFCTECGTRKPENICAACGADYGEQSPKFCSECGAKMGAEEAAPSPVTAEEPQTPQIQQVFENENGTLSVLWNSDGVTEYEIRYLPCTGDDLQADLDAWSSLGYYYAKDTVGFCTLTKTLPGQDYWIGLFDAQGDGSYIAFESQQELELFTALESQGYSWPVINVNETKTDVDGFTLAQTGEGSVEEPGMFLAVEYDNPGEAQELLAKIAVEDPNGGMLVLHTIYMSFEADVVDELTGWNFISLADYFAIQRALYGEVPLGGYYFCLLLEGKVACVGEFAVAEDGAAAVAEQTAAAEATAAPAAATITATGLEITGVQNEGRGAYTVAWTDNGMGPYNVYYHQRFTDDVEADWGDERGTGRWIDAESIDATSWMLWQLIPGTDYWITVSDSTGAETVYAYTTPEAGVCDLNMSVSSIPRKLADGVYTDLTSFSAAELNASYTEEYGLYMDVYYDNPAAETLVAAQFVMTLPDGVTFCEYAFDLNLFPQGSTYWECYDLDWAFANIKRWYGEVPQGVYCMDLYVEGNYATTAVFLVME